LKAQKEQLNEKIAALQDRRNDAAELSKLYRETGLELATAGLVVASIGLASGPFGFSLTGIGIAISAGGVALGFASLYADQIVAKLDKQIAEHKAAFDKIDAQIQALARAPKAKWVLGKPTDLKATSWAYYGDTLYTQTTRFGENYSPGITAKISDGYRIDDPSTIREWYEGRKVPWIYTDTPSFKKLKYIGD
jgi:hypothetical protein